MDHSTPGFPVHHQFPEPIQTHFHRISDSIQLSHPWVSHWTPTSFIPGVRVFSNELVLCIRWPKSWSFSFSISPSSEYSGLVSFRMDWLDRLSAFTVLADSTQDSGPCRRAQGTCFVCAHRVTDETAYWARRCPGHLYMVCCTESPPDPRGRQATVTRS